MFLFFINFFVVVTWFCCDCMSCCSGFWLAIASHMNLSEETRSAFLIDDVPLAVKHSEWMQ